MDALSQLEDNDAEVSAAFGDHPGETDSVGTVSTQAGSHDTDCGPIREVLNQ